jgi:hypothetical protein
MAIPQVMIDAMNQIDSATTEVGEDLLRLRDQVKVGMTQADVDAVKDRLTAQAARLTEFAKDPEDPVPTPNPEPTPTPESRRR